MTFRMITEIRKQDLDVYISNLEEIHPYVDEKGIEKLNAVIRDLKEHRAYFATQCSERVQ